MKRAGELIEKADVTFKDVIGWIGAAVGVAATIYAASVAPETPEFGAIFGGLMVLQTLLLVIFLRHLHLEFKYKKSVEKMNAVVDELESEIAQYKDKLRRETERYEAELLKEKDAEAKQVDTIAGGMKKLCKFHNDFCMKIPEISAKTYNDLEDIREPTIKEEEAVRRIQRSIIEFSDRLMEIYRRYTKELLDSVVSMERALLKMRGYDLRIAATVKLFREPYYAGAEQHNVVIYTAFRDAWTYENQWKNAQDNDKRREIGEELYTIGGNSDFSHCLKKEHFIINNAIRGSDSYANEHTDFDDFYNCAIVVPIRIRLRDGTYQFIGYLCCDCKNPNQDDKAEILDRKMAQMLFAMAQLYAVFFATLESNWQDRDPETSRQPTTFLEVVYKKTYVGK